MGTSVANTVEVTQCQTKLLNSSALVELSKMEIKNHPNGCGSQEETTTLCSQEYVLEQVTGLEKN